MSAPSVAPKGHSTVTSYLSWDHDRLDALLAEARRMAQDGEVERAEDTFREFLQGLRRHIRLEEEVLFPIFEEKTGLSRGPTAVMRHEHREIESILEQMREVLERGDPHSFEHLHSELIDVLGPHNEKEENILYPMTDRALPHDEREALAEKLARL